MRIEVLKIGERALSQPVYDGYRGMSLEHEAYCLNDDEADEFAYAQRIDNTISLHQEIQS